MAVETRKDKDEIDKCTKDLGKVFFSDKDCKNKTMWTNIGESVGMCTKKTVKNTTYYLYTKCDDMKIHTMVYKDDKCKQPIMANGKAVIYHAEFQKDNKCRTMWDPMENKNLYYMLYNNETMKKMKKHDKDGRNRQEKSMYVIKKL
jgi:hypothetical protein